MNLQKSFIIALLIVILSAACAPVAAQTESSRVFSIAVILDTTTDSVRQEEREEILALASAKLEDLTGFTFQETIYLEDGQGGTVEEIVLRYMSTNDKELPNGIILFSAGDEDRAKIGRGYSQKVTGPNGFRNSFISSANESDQMYVAIVYFNYHYAACGYGAEDTVQSEFAIGDECGGDLSACSEWNGMQVCEIALPFLTTPTQMIAGVVVHEFMHPFDWEIGPEIHYGSDACNAKMGWSMDHSDEEAEYYVAICPYVFENFVRSYKP
jgi:hypothetical protein